MENKSVFISSCTRRQLWRRRPGRHLFGPQLLIAAIVLAVALGAFMAGHGGV
jgi:hypothetical protein